MASRFSGRLRAFTRHRRIGFLHRISAFVGKLPPSDRAIIALLSLAVVITSLAGFVALERTILVPVPVTGGSLTEGEVGSPRFVNPLLALSDADRDVTALTYAGLMGKGPKGLRPVIAESYAVTEDGKVYTFTIRKNAKFSDGTPITADDVVFTVEKAQDQGLKSPQLSNWASVRAEAIDARTVRFTLSKAYAPFLSDTTLGILPAHIWKGVSNEQFPFDTHVEEPVGAGPFKIAHVVRNASGVITEYDLVANGNYALGRPYLDRITLKFYASTDALANAYKNHGIESAYGIPVKGARTAPYARVFALFFNQGDNKAFADLAVRKALSVAIDRTVLVHDDLGGYGVPLMGPVPPGSAVTSPQIPPGDAIANAKAILTNAGWTLATSTNVWTNKKEKLTLDSVTISTSNVPELKTIAGAVEADWEKLGVPTSITYYDPSALVATVIRPRSFDTLFFGMVIGEGGDLFPFWDSSQKTDPGLNIAQYSNKNVDALLEKARTEADPTARAADIQKASDAIAADYPAAFMYAPDFVYALPNRIQGASLPQITAPADRFASVEEWHERTEWVWPFLAPVEYR